MSSATMAPCVAIVAVATNGVIGRDNQLPWRLPDDLRRFKSLTVGHAVLMGRKTWDSLGRPLPGRSNLVLTRQRGWQAQGCQAVASLDEARAAVPAGQTLFIIGGAEVYRACWGVVERVELTEVHASIKGDTRLQGFKRDEWREAGREDHAADAAHAQAFSYLTLLRR